MGQQAVEEGQEWVWEVEEGEDTMREDWGMEGGTRVASSYQEEFCEPRARYECMHGLGKRSISFSFDTSVRLFI